MISLSSSRTLTTYGSNAQHRAPASGAGGRLTIAERNGYFANTQPRFHVDKAAVALASIAVLSGLCLLSSSVSAMSLRILGDQLILSGRVADGDYDKVKAALDAHSGIQTVILRNSIGGHAPSGYMIGDLFRQLGMATAVSGYCYSSCSRMFLGGQERRFTDDFPLEATEVGFHGHYDADGQLNSHAVQQYGLKRWIIRHSDGKADLELIERWINIPISVGMIHFYHPTLAVAKGASSFLCQGTEPAGQRVFGCEKIVKSALDLGVLTTADYARSNDYANVQATIPKRPAKSDYAAITELVKVPLTSSEGLEQYKRFLEAPVPRAFAIAPSQSNWAWNSGTWDAITLALTRWEQRAGQPCFLYAVDEDVVWQGPLR